MTTKKWVNFNVLVGGGLPPIRDCRYLVIEDEKHGHIHRKSNNKTIWSGFVTIGNQRLKVIAFSAIEPTSYDAIFGVRQENLKLHDKKGRKRDR